MKIKSKKATVSVKTLKTDVKQYIKFKAQGKNAKEWYDFIAMKNLLKNHEVTVKYIAQMTKQEFDVTVLFAMKLISQFDSEEIARNFIYKYFEFYKNFLEEEKTYQEIMFPVFQYIETSPNYNRLNFTKEMKEMMKGWKGKLLKGYIENDDINYVTIVRFLIENQVFDLDNEYVAYWNSREDTSELSCFSCVEKAADSFLQYSTVGGKYKETTIGAQIRDIYIVKDIQKETEADGKQTDELTFETALIIQTEKHCYAFWRNLIFDTIESAVCKDVAKALKLIKSVDEIREEAQVENPYTVEVTRVVEQL